MIVHARTFGPKKNEAKLVKFLSESIFDELDAMYSGNYFFSYAVDKKGLKYLKDERKRLLILISEKGSGKTALFKLASKFFLNNKDKQSIVLDIVAPDISPEEEKTSIDSWATYWKTILIEEILDEISQAIKMPLNTDKAKLIEFSQGRGTRSESILNYILARVKLKGVELKDKEISGSLALLNRMLDSNSKVTIFIDDIDVTFDGLKKSILRIAGFFSAIRDLVRKLPDLCIRATVKPDTWAILCREYSFLSNLRQKEIVLNWTDSELHQMLNRRIEAWVNRCFPSRTIDALLEEEPDKDLCRLLFDYKNFDLGEGKRRPHKILCSLSHSRPSSTLSL